MTAGTIILITMLIEFYLAMRLWNDSERHRERIRRVRAGGHYAR